jgi:hypothetical protein
MPGLDDILTVMDGNSQQPDQQQTDPNQQQQQQQTQTDPSQQQQQSQQDGQQQQQQQQQQDDDFNPEEMFGGSKGKQNAAFAKMRTENSRMAQTLSKLGQMLGIPNYQDEEALLTGLNNKMLELQANQSKIPLDFLQQHEEMQQKLTTFERAQLAAQTELGFQKVKDTYQLSNADLKAFATKLFEEGKNPYTQPINLLNEYRMMYFDQILEKSKAAAAEEALKLDQKAQQKSTKPSSATGTGGNAQQGFQNMADLDNILASMDKK